MRYLNIKVYHNDHYNVWWDALHIFDSCQCQYLIISLRDQFNKLSVLESENLYILLHLLLDYPLPFDENVIPMRGEEFVKDTTECEIFHSDKLF